MLVGFFFSLLGEARQGEEKLWKTSWVYGKRDGRKNGTKLSVH